MRVREQPKFSYYNNTMHPLEVRPSQIVNGGMGVFMSSTASEPIAAGAFIGFYEGVWNCDAKNQSNYSYYINKRVCIDLSKDNRRPITAMMNDAFRTDFTNNVISKLLVDQTILESIRAKNCDNFNPCRIVGLYATKEIRPGEELFFEYGESYWTSW
jgi:hypothetical protein